MRQGTSKSGMLTHEGVFFGICLGADYCAEHENGIKELMTTFGVKNSEDSLGVRNLQITKVPEDITFFTKGQSTYLLHTRSLSWAKDMEKFKADFHRRPTELNIYAMETKPKMAGAWSERDFGIHVQGKELKAQLTELWEAIQRKDVAFGFTSKMPAFDNAGLCLFIVSKFPKVFNDSLIAQQDEKKALRALADKTGVIAHLESKGKGAYKGYFACVPHRDEKEVDGIRWWFNAYDQQNNNSNWFSSKELREWADGVEGNRIAKVKNTVKG